LEGRFGSLEIAGILIGGALVLGFGISLCALFKKFNAISQRITALTRDEINEFREGNGGRDPGDDSHIRIEWIPYNTKFELPKSRIFPGQDLFLWQDTKYLII
jgi:hypothetical protein